MFLSAQGSNCRPPHDFPHRAMTALVNSLVVAVPPRSPVRTPAASVPSNAAVSWAAAADWPRWSSIIAAAHICPTGLAMPLPAMSGADPWTGSNIDG